MIYRWLYGLWHWWALPKRTYRCDGCEVIRQFRCKPEHHDILSCPHCDCGYRCGEWREMGVYVGGGRDG